MTSVPIAADRRSHRRFNLQIPLRYRTADGPIHSAWKRGGMLNMSASGLLIGIPGPATAGTKLELAMDWTGLYHGRQTMRLFLVAQVTRTGARGTALRILSHSFRDVTPARVRPERAVRNLAVA
jgi:hypothetical protein